VVHVQDRVIFVKPLRSHYRPDTGDVIVGRVVAVEQSRWSVDINSYQHALLNLTAINLPGGVQRRKVEEDKLHMREHFVEGDLIVAEV
jgi:exosome complex component RRP4